MKQLFVKYRLAQAALICATLLGFFSAPALAAGDATVDAKAVQRALPVGFPVPENSWLIGKESFVVKIGVKNMTVAGLVAFFEKGLKKAGYQIVISTDKMSSVGTSIDEWWDMLIILPGTNDKQPIFIRRSGDVLSFSTNARK